MQTMMIFLADHVGLTSALIGILTLLMIVEFLRLKRLNFNTDVSQTVQLINRQHAVVIDLRSPEEFTKGHIIHALSIPFKEILTSPKKIDKYQKKPIVLVCRTGYESQKIATSFRKQGYTVYSLRGGIKAWIQADLPLATT